jgi:hypothetical protein
MSLFTNRTDIEFGYKSKYIILNHANVFYYYIKLSIAKFHRYFSLKFFPPHLIVHEEETQLFDILILSLNVVYNFKIMSLYALTTKGKYSAFSFDS